MSMYRSKYHCHNLWCVWIEDYILQFVVGKVPGGSLLEMDFGNQHNIPNKLNLQIMSFCYQVLAFCGYMTWVCHFLYLVPTYSVGPTPPIFHPLNHDILRFVGQQWWTNHRFRFQAYNSADLVCYIPSMMPSLFPLPIVVLLFSAMMMSIPKYEQLPCWICWETATSQFFSHSTVSTMSMKVFACLNHNIISGLKY